MQHNLTGQQLGTYKLGDLIGVGGMSAVYESYQTTVRRKVAVKVLPPQFASQADYAERFEREVQLAALLEHPHILPIYDHGTDQGISYIVMRLLTGGTLSQRLEFFKRPSLREALLILRQIGSGLDYAHKQNIIHRDLKASNVLFDTEGNAYLADFGIAKLLQVERSGLTTTGQAMGTPAYMSPEQWRGENVDARADIYALGIIAYILLTDEMPFQASTPYAMMHKHLHESAKLPSLLQPNLPPAVNLVMNRVLAKDPNTRYPTASSFVNALEESIAEIPTQESLTTGFLGDQTFNTLPPVPAGPLEDTRTPFDRKRHKRRANNRVMVATLLLIGLGLIGLGGLIVFLSNSDNPKENQPSATPATIAKASEETSISQALTDENTPIPTNTPKVETTPTPDTAPENPLQITAKTGSQVELLKTIPGREAQDAVWSPDSQFLALARPDGVHIVALADLDDRVLRGHTDDVVTVAFNPDGSKIASGGDDNTVRIWETRTGSELSVLQGHTNNVHSVAFSPDGTQLVSGGADGKIWLWNVADGSGVLLGGHSRSVEEVAFSPDGKLVASAGSDFMVRVWDVQTRTMLTELAGHTDLVFTVAFNPTGTRLASGSADRTLRIWDIQNSDTLDILQPPGSWITNIKYSPDGSLLAIASSDGALQLWDVASDETIATLQEQGPAINKLAFTSDGAMLVSVSAQGDVKIWALHQTEEMLNLPVRLTRPTAINEVIPYDSLWTPLQNKFRDMTSPGTAEYELAINPAQTLRWNYVWCTANDALLQTSLAALTMKFFLNEVDIGSKYWFEYNYTENDHRCHSWTTLVSNWAFTDGSPLDFDIRYTLTRTVTDGNNSYQAGDYIQRIRVSPAE
ncbi:MAG: serine/threonine protein kinase [Chloroflexi bacterium]|nr:serine/threonine protein kinase [Chloroflexota bacterium]